MRVRVTVIGCRATEFDLKSADIRSFDFPGPRGYDVWRKCPSRYERRCPRKYGRQARMSAKVRVMPWFWRESSRIRLEGLALPRTGADIRSPRSGLKTRLLCPENFRITVGYRIAAVQHPAMSAAVRVLFETALGRYVSKRAWTGPDIS